MTEDQRRQMKPRKEPEFAEVGEVVVDRSTGRLFIDGNEFPYYISDKGVTIEHGWGNGDSLVEFQVFMFARDVRVEGEGYCPVTVHYAPNRAAED